MMETIEKCQCHNFASWASILDFVETDVKCKAIQAWLEDDGYQNDSDSLRTRRLSRPAHVKLRCHEFRWSGHSQLRGTSHSACQNRRAMAMVLIQELREACRHALDTPPQHGRLSPTHDFSKCQFDRPVHIQCAGDELREGGNQQGSYHQSFPKLMTHTLDMDKPTILTPRKKKEKVPSKPNSATTAPPSHPVQTNQHILMKSMSIGSKEHEIMNRLLPPSTDSSSTQQSNNPWKTPATTHSTEKAPLNQASPELMIQRLASTYSILLLRSLVPSSAVEVHFLLNLLNLHDEDDQMVSSQRRTRNDDPSIQSLFYTHQQCRHFASLVLVQISSALLWTWGPHWTFDLLHLPSFSYHIPWQQRNLLHQRWHEIITAFQQGPITTNHGYLSHNSLLSTPIQFFFVQGLNEHVGHAKDTRAWKEAQSATTPSYGLLDHAPSSLLMTLPFDEQRDSRHLHKSKELSSLFQNREQCRDSFLFQLRSFQQLKGSVLDPVHMDQYLQEYRNSCRDIMQSLSSSNVAWFADFFCDLLLQIGLVPMQEMDVDILSHVPDKDRLQKLHKRFTAKVPPKNKPRPQPSQNTVNLSVSSNQTEYLFTGHQDFFHLFITWTDSHSFLSHLQNRLKHLLSTLMNQPMDRCPCQILILKLCLVSRFLGLLNFYPWWTVAHDLSQIDMSLCTCNIPLLEYIKDAWIDGKLTITIPWVVDYLRIMTWNERSLQSLYFKKVFGVLRSIHVNISFHNTHSEHPSPLYQANRALVSLFLEGIFCDMVSWDDSEALQLYELPPAALNTKSTIACIDRTFPFVFCKPVLSLSSSHIDDLIKNVAQMITNPSNRSSNGHSTSSKKLKPLPVGRISTPPSDANYIFMNKNAQEDDSSLVFIRKRLVDLFFHHHKNLEQVCRFVSSQYSKNLSMNIIEYLSPIIDFLLEGRKLTSSLFPDTDVYASLILRCEEDLRLRTQGMIEDNCVSFVTASISSLADSKSTPSFASLISTKITVAEVESSSVMSVSSACRSFVKRKVEDFVNGTNMIKDRSDARMINKSLQRLVDLLRMSQRNPLSFVPTFGKELVSIIRLMEGCNKILLKILYSSPFDELLSSLVLLIQTSNLHSCSGVNDPNCTRHFVDLYTLHILVDILFHVRNIGYNSKELSSLFSVLSSTLMLENIVSNRCDGRPSQIDSSAADMSYTNIHHVHSTLLIMVESRMIKKCALSRALRNLLSRSQSPYVSFRCVTLLGSLKL